MSTTRDMLTARLAELVAEADEIKRMLGIYAAPAEPPTAQRILDYRRAEVVADTATDFVAKDGDDGGRRSTIDEVDLFVNGRPGRVTLADVCVGVDASREAIKSALYDLRGRGAIKRIGPSQYAAAQGPEVDMRGSLEDFAVALAVARGIVTTESLVAALSDRGAVSKAPSDVLRRAMNRGDLRKAGPGVYTPTNEARR